MSFTYSLLFLVIYFFSFFVRLLILPPLCDGEDNGDISLELVNMGAAGIGNCESTIFEKTIRTEGLTLSSSLNIPIITLPISFALSVEEYVDVLDVDTCVSWLSASA
jgi:hypothetical protein